MQEEDMKDRDLELEEYFMRRVLNVAKRALQVGEVPVGCIIVLREAPEAANATNNNNTNATATVTATTNANTATDTDTADIATDAATDTDTADIATDPDTACDMATNTATPSSSCDLDVDVDVDVQEENYKDSPCVIISHGANQVNATRDASRHAECIAIDRMLTGSMTSDSSRLPPSIIAKAVEGTCKDMDGNNY